MKGQDGSSLKTTITISTTPTVIAVIIISQQKTEIVIQGYCFAPHPGPRAAENEIILILF